MVSTGCGAADSESEAGGSSATALDGVAPPPATRLLVPPLQPGDDGFEPVTAIDAAEVDEPCPTDERVEVEAGDVSTVQQEQFRLEPMLGVVLQYGSERPDVFGGYGLHWASNGDGSVFVSFTTDVAEHRAALMEKVEFPDQLIVCQAAASEVERSAIQATLVDELGGRFTSIGGGGKSGAVEVGLNATEEALASELVDRYGAAVVVTVGALAFPIDRAEIVCGPALEADVIDGLDVEIIEPATPLSMTEAGTFGVTVRLSNVSTQPISFDSGQPTATIADEQGEPLSTDTRSFGDLGIPIDLEPGTHQDFELTIALASCDPSVGYVIPPGERFVVVSFYNAQLQGDMNSRPLPIVIAN